MGWGNNPMGDFGPKIPDGAVTGARTAVAEPPRQDNVVPIHAELVEDGAVPQFAEPAPRPVPSRAPAPVFQAAQLIQPVPEALGAVQPSLQGLAMHLAPLLVAGVAGGAAGALAAKTTTGAVIGASAGIAVVGLARALAGGMYGIPTQLRAVDGAVSVAGAVGAGYLAFFAEPTKPKKAKPKKRRPLFLQREDDFDEDEAEEHEA